jgi:glucuronosyltransferase
MPNTSLQALMDAFAELPQKVVFKFEEDVLDKPSNVMIRRWLPQRDILGRSIFVHHINEIVTFNL